MKDFKEINSLIIQWAKQKGILDKGTPLAQHKKTLEEVNELGESLLADKNGLEYYTDSKGVFKNTREAIKDDLGDSFVTLLIQCEMQDINPLEAMQEAYNIISKRSGEMKNGTFVKDK